MRAVLALPLCTAVALVGCGGNHKRSTAPPHDAQPATGRQAQLSQVRSQKTTVTAFRSSTRGGASARRWPHSEQNFAAAAFSEPHAGQRLKPSATC
jgi:hypothetical protein